MVQIDASGSGGLVDPGVACWVGISEELGAREESGMSAWQFAVMKLARALLRLAFDRSFQCPVHSGRKWYTLVNFGESGLLENEPTAPAEQAHTTQRQ